MASTENERDEQEEKEQESGEDGKRDGKNVGRIEEIQGVVIEVVFPDELPEINHAITVDRSHEETSDETDAREDDERIHGTGGRLLVCEVQQHLGDDRVRAVAMDSTDGL